ncbi:ATP-grasp domain-containing protein [Pseudomaricurvus alcaniphilus]|uniref:ATP-binding protein n=1 Tax=Pseudomaricurvus alcaniphilus TaxID=1166482 RepID=UPI00140892E9|nr:biotin carboxylase N-terminal domain-containing protein [Pseudomaricurvus alcaniphilus]NHN37947.1 ATP-grasp domain-containing protein [Pseudomaricurvus alcaniphilus]
MFSRVLIANRGLIQANCVRAVKELGCRAITVYDPGDRQNTGVRNADESHELKVGNSRIPYEDIDQIVALAEQLQVDAVHPGYGFLAQNAVFRQRLQAKGIQLIAPGHAADVQLEDKPQLRRLARSLGLPVLPGSDTLTEVAELKAAAEKIGYPLMMKASQGYGGIGIRVIEREADIEPNYRQIKGQADRYLSRAEDVYLEKYLPGARHIEFPLARDQFGNLVIFPERECTIQRRFRKVVTETPSSCISSVMRGRLKTAVEILMNRLKISGFVSVEFLYDSASDQAYFLEINDYIQPSHSVSALHTGVDILREQVSIAARQRLTITQKDVEPRGVAMGVFIAAEDPEHGFVPSPGVIERLHLPYGDGVYSQTNVCSGDSVGTFYDPIIALVMAVESSRERALAKMTTALDGMHIDGIRSNIPLMRALMRYPDFVRSQYDARLISDGESRERIYENFRTREQSEIAALIAALSIQRDANNQNLLDQARRDSRSKIWDMASDLFSRQK